MADVASTLAGWSSTTASNAPADTTTIGSGLAGNLREIQGVLVRGLSNKGSDIASGATTDLGGTEGLAHDISGTTTITSFGTGRAGLLKIIQFDGALTLTHNASSLVLPGAANITTVAGDVAIMFSEGSGNWRCYGYFRSATGAYLNINGATEDTSPDLGADYILTYDASATAAPKKVIAGRIGSGVLATEQASTSGTSIDFTSIPSWAKKITVLFSGVSTNGTSVPIIQIGDSGGLKNTNYLCSGSNITTAVTSSNYTTGFGIGSSQAAASILHGAVVLVLEDATNFTWVCSYSIGQSDGALTRVGGGSKSLSAALDRVSVTTVNGTDEFDAGDINILYE